MPRDLFADPTTDRPAPRTSRLIPISIALHGIVVAAVVVVPLLAVGEPPPVHERSPVMLVAQRPLPRVDLVPAPAQPRRARIDRDAANPPRPDRPAVSITTPDRLVPEAEIDTGVPDWFPRGGGSVGVGHLPSSGGERVGVAAATIPSGPLPLGGRIQRPRKLRHVDPEYPRIAKEARIHGIVVIDAVIGPDGFVRQAIVRRSDSPLLESAALAAVRQWTYEPTRLNDVAVAIVMSVEVRFTLAR